MKLQNYRNIKQTVFGLISGFILTPREKERELVIRNQDRVFINNVLAHIFSCSPSSVLA